jgi:uncharacterized protein YegP (UPF0339 family)
MHVTDADAQRGLYGKFHVERTDGDPTGKHAGCRYFTLDPQHDPYAATALAVYAVACAPTYPALSSDLHRWRSELAASWIVDRFLTLYVDAAGEWRWNLRAGNHELIADSGEGYKNYEDACHGAKISLALLIDQTQRQLLPAQLVPRVEADGVHGVAVRIIAEPQPSSGPSVRTTATIDPSALADGGVTTGDDDEGP